MVQREANKTINQHPKPKDDQINGEVDLDVDLENYQYPSKELIPAFILRKRIRELTSVIPLELENLTKEDIYKIISLKDPRFNLDFDNIKAVTNVKYLSDRLDLMLEYDSLFGKKQEIFNEEFTYDKAFFKWRKLVYEKDAYLYKEENYYKLDSSILENNDSKATILRNSRVLLYWKGVELSKISIQRILTLGLSYLIGHISRAELIIKIRNNLPEGMYEVNIKGEKWNFILITIHEPMREFY